MEEIKWQGNLVLVPKALITLAESLKQVAPDKEAFMIPCQVIETKQGSDAFNTLRIFFNGGRPAVHEAEIVKEETINEEENKQ